MKRTYSTTGPAMACDEKRLLPMIDPKGTIVVAVRNSARLHVGWVQKGNAGGPVERSFPLTPDQARAMAEALWSAADKAAAQAQPSASMLLGQALHEAVQRSFAPVVDPPYGPAIRSGKLDARGAYCAPETRTGECPCGGAWGVCTYHGGKP